MNTIYNEKDDIVKSVKSFLEQDLKKVMTIDFNSFDIFSEDYPNLKSTKNELSLTFEKGLPNNTVRIYFTDSKLFVFSFYMSELAFVVNENSIEIKEFINRSNLIANRINIKQNSIIATVIIKKNNKHVFDFNYINFGYSQPKAFKLYSDYVKSKRGEDPNSFIIKQDIYDNGELGRSNEFSHGTYGQVITQKDRDLRNKSDYILLNDSKSKNCYIATAVYKDIEHPNVKSLRKYRDEILSNYILGELFIKKYYRYAPKLTKHFSGKSIFNTIIKHLLDIVVKIIEHKN